MRHDVIAFLTDVAEHVGPGVALRALRHDLERRASTPRSRSRSATPGGCCCAGVERVRARAARAARSSSATRRASAAPTACTPSPPPSASSCWCSTRRCAASACASSARSKRRRSARSRAPSAPSRTCRPTLEEAVCARLGIGFEPAATQVVQRDRHAAFVAALALVRVEPRQDRRRAAPPRAHRGARGAGGVRQRARRARRRCRTSATPGGSRTCRAWRA